ncbi:ABC transporter permease subunit [Azospirillum melinis]|uniref:ABC transporter permease subunit n=1 Tax=Azospirillum melinis TaxID=328839 RepID=A0ABX2K8U7_9PROT|nr:ABC transporter permease [Azospirillum melinis]MBP2305806.1 peptide/nickel transport system permease protein [Azospirillum melinis]NUA99097.1 ABC transporter permease subunit [Azospirillum melinis]
MSLAAGAPPQGEQQQGERQHGPHSSVGTVWRGFATSGVALGSLAVFLLLAGAALLAPWIAPQNPFDLTQLDVLDGRLAPGSPGGAGGTYWLGTDDQGRDMLSAILYGLRLSLLVGIGSALVAGSAGTFVGLAAAQAGGRTDSALMRLADLQLAFPSILIALMVIAFLGRGIGNVLLALILVEWAYYARAARSAALVELKSEYVEAARCLVLPEWRILLRHVLPNCLPSLVVIATTQVARAIALEATLSFLGLGVSVTEPSLGLLIANGRNYVLSGETWISLYPGVALLAVMAAINLAGDHLRDTLNPRLER